MNNEPVPPTPLPTKPPESAITQYARRAAQEKAALSTKPVHPVLSPEERDQRMKRSGLVLAFLTSLVFGLVSQIGNRLLLPGIPLSPSLLEIVVVLVMLILAGMMIGFISVTSLKAQNRIMLGFILLFAGLFFWYMLHLGNIISGFFLGTFVVMLLASLLITILLLVLPYGLLIHFAARMQVQYFYQPWWHWRRWLLPLMTLVLTLLVGSRFIYTPAEQHSLRGMAATLRQAALARSEMQLPEKIAGMQGTPFLPYAKGSYRLTLVEHQWFPYEVNSDGTPRIVEIVIISEFRNHYHLSCRFTPAGSMIDCYSDWVPPSPDREQASLQLLNRITTHP